MSNDNVKMLDFLLEEGRMELEECKRELELLSLSIKQLEEVARLQRKSNFKVPWVKLRRKGSTGALEEVK